MSMSWAWTEFSGELTNDSTDFTTPSGHLGGSAWVGGTDLAGNVTFVAAAGDNGAYYPQSTTISPEYPACSPNVVSVGGTILTVGGTDPNNYRGNETVWGNGTSSGTQGGGGTGISNYENQPSYQNGVVSAYSTSKRTFPDISLNAGVGVSIYDSWIDGNSTPWHNTNDGTSLACPMFAGMIAIADEGRAIAGLGSLDGRNQVLPTLYTLAKNPSTYAEDFYDVTSGSNGPSPTYVAGPGYDLASGLGSPVGNLLIPALCDLGPAHLVFAEQPIGDTAGLDMPLPVIVNVEDSDGNIVTSDNSYVTLAVEWGPGTLMGTTTVKAVNGVATFNNLYLTTASNAYALVASDGSLIRAVSNGFTVSPAAPYELAFAQQPTNCTAGVVISPAVIVDVEDQYGNIDTFNNSNVTLGVEYGPATLLGTTTVTAVNGVATFNNLYLTTASNINANYLAALDGSLFGRSQAASW